VLITLSPTSPSTKKAPRRYNQHKSIHQTVTVDEWRRKDEKNRWNCGQQEKEILEKVRNEYFMARMESFPQFNTAWRVIKVNFTTSKLELNKKRHKMFVETNRFGWENDVRLRLRR
jgi:hypothetical protein